MVCAILVREDLQTTLERRARWLFPAGTAVPLVSASPSGMGREISGLCQGGNLSLFWAGDAGMGSLGAGTSFLQEVGEPLCQEHRAP